MYHFSCPFTLNDSWVQLTLMSVSEGIVLFLASRRYAMMLGAKKGRPCVGWVHWLWCSNTPTAPPDPPVFASEEREPLFGFSQIRAHEEMRNQEEDLKVKIYLLDFKNLYSKWIWIWKFPCLTKRFSEVELRHSAKYQNITERYLSNSNNIIDELGATV